LLGSEKCKNYGTAALPKYKPAGLLHEFGESRSSGVEAALAEFGLMMGSYDNNLEGGILRKNMGQLNDEIDSATGVFVSAGVGKGGIIKSFDEITHYGYDLSSGNYAQTCYSDAITNGNCPSWGNPVSELLLESLRYYAGKSAAYTTGTKDAAVGLPVVTTRTDPLTNNPAIGASTRSKLYGLPVCRPLNMLTITSGASSYDNTLSNLSDLGTTSSAAALTNVIGDKEGITNTTRLIGSVIGGAGANDLDLLCTPKLVTGLGNLSGVCPEGPNFKGTYLGAGIAHYSNTNKIRSDITLLPFDAPGNALMVRNYGVSMSGGLATVIIPTGDGKNVYITPASRDYVGGKILPANMVDFKYLSLSADQKSGSALVLWQHSMLGEDQDQDQLQSLRWELVGTTLRVYSQAIEANTGSSSPMATGYTLVGTSADGIHLHSSINDYPTTELSVDTSLALYSGSTGGAVGVGCTLSGRSLCVKIGSMFYRGETFKSYTVTGSTNALIREPLWYMSKYGGFSHNPKGGENSTVDKFPTASNIAAWDIRRADGKPCGGTSGLSCSDGEPDNYFLARSPELLESSLRDILADIVASSNTSPAVASSQLNSGDFKYVAKFDPNDGHGELSAFVLDATTRLFSADPTWGAHTELSKTASISRSIITNIGATGIAFSWADLNTTQRNVLQNGEPDPLGTNEYGKAMLQWLRGDTTDKSRFRVRSASSVMGAIVNSNPTVQGKPNSNFADADYVSFINTWKNRDTLLWAGAGDGMLHGFNAGSGNGTPIISYIPEPVFSRLPNWASAAGPKVQPFVDGSPFTGDVKVGGAWATYLFSSLGRGGKGIFALDVTSPSVLASAVNAANVFKWQFTVNDDADMGYILSEPTRNGFSGQSGQIAKMNNGKFAVLFGNGVKSTSGKSALYILFADGPSSGSWAGKFKKLIADTGANNGLSQPVWVDENNDGTADSIYAGDLKGNLWKFDVKNADPANWKVAFLGKPLYVAKDEFDNLLPITGAPVTRFNPVGGIMVNFATGLALDPTNFPDMTKVNTIFGIWDNPAYGSMNTTQLDAALPRGLTDMAQRHFATTATSTSLYVRGIPIDLSIHKGWSLAFYAESEMSLSNSVIANNQLIVLSVIPAIQPLPGDPTQRCTNTPTARLTAVDPFTGMPTGLLGTIEATEYDGSLITVNVAAVDVKDQKIQFTSTSVSPPGTDGLLINCADGTIECIKGITTGRDGPNFRTIRHRNRIYWREIPGLKTRGS
jgi:type IV pilus assembly protein PilY1